MSGLSQGEQISIQLGNYANYVGTHFWNYQDELYMRCMDEEIEPLYKGHSVDVLQLFRLGRTPSGTETCTPRLLAVDRKEHMTACNPAGASIFKHEAATDVLAAWAGPLTTVAAEPAFKNSFQRLLESEEQQPDGAGGTGEAFDGMKDSEVTQWSDFLKVHLHPRSVMPLPIRSGHTFDHFFAGRNTATHLTRDGAEELMDSLRRMLEECDRLACVQTLVDVDDGFGGLAVQVLEYFRDEVRGAVMPVWAFPEVHGNAGAKEDGTRSKDQCVQRCGTTVATAQLAELASVLVSLDAPSLARVQKVPHCFPVFSEHRFDPATIFHTSAMAASIIETVTGSQRIKLSSAKGQPESSMQENLWSASEWVLRATRNGQLPVCDAAAGLGYPHSAEEVDALFGMPSPVSQYGSDLRVAAAHPFLSPVSAVHHGSWGIRSLPSTQLASGLPPTDDGRRAVNRDIYSNLLFSRGSSSIAVRERVLSKCGEYSCVVNAFQHRNAPLPLPLCFPDVFPRRSFDASDASLLARYYYNGRLSSADMMVSVNTSPAVGRHLGLHAENWKQTARGVRSQLAQAGCDAEESEELEERLFSLSERYSSS